jgi:hypothetical protein
MAVATPVISIEELLPLVLSAGSCPYIPIPPAPIDTAYVPATTDAV